MFKFTFQTRTYLQMAQMGWTEWQECLGKAQPIVNEVRRLLKLFAETGDKQHKTKADALKRSLPGACFQASDFEESMGSKGYNKGKLGRWREQVHARLSGLAVIDVDHIGNPRELFAEIQAKHDLKELGILLVYVSASGEGLKIVFKCRKEWGNLICNQYEMAELLQVPADDACKDSSRLSFLTGEDDVLYLDKEALFNADGGEETACTDYDQAFGERYRQAPKGDSSPNVQKWIDYEDQLKKKRKQKASSTESVEQESPQAAEPDKPDTPQAPESAEPDAPQTTESVEQPDAAIISMLNGHYGTSLPTGKRHPTFIGETAQWLLWLTDNNPARALSLALQLDYVRNWTDRQPNELENCISTVQQKPLLTRCPKRLAELMTKAGIDNRNVAPGGADSTPEEQLPFDEWIEAIRSLFDVYPCLREVCEPHPERLWPFLFFAAAALLGTDMTLTWYYFYDQPEQKRRLNYNVLGIGDPASGKGALTRIASLITEPIAQSDQLANDAINAWKEEQRSKGANKDRSSKPKGIIRLHGARTSNTVFITDMMNAVVEVQGEMMHQHMLTVDTEAINGIKMQKGGSWIDRQVMEIKAWSNEEDSQQYANLDSVTGFFRIFWNQVRTATPPALKVLTNERNFGTGYPTRLSVIPILGTGFQMMPLRRKSQKAIEANNVLREWAYKLDKRQGELPLWPMVEHCWHWTNNHMEIAAFNNDKADELLMKRVAMTSLCIAAPWVDMRHWEEREKTGSYETDETDLKMLDLVLAIQYLTQHYYFGELARNYFDEQMKDATHFIRRTSRYEQCFMQLPDEFTTEQFSQTFGFSNNHSANKALTRLMESKAIERTKRGEYRKRVKCLT